MAAVDWGTSSFRIWLLDEQGNTLKESRSDEGMLKAGEKGFEAILESHFERLDAASDLPVMICGMAGSRQGWMEAPYIFCPARLKDIPKNTVSMPGKDRLIRILPGIAQRDANDPDVMRGEETQLLGLGERIGAGRHLVCMPGTHCKWVVIDNGVVQRFATWTTGELFNLMATASILRHSIAPNVGKILPDDPVFRQWAKRGIDDPGAVFRHFFTIRASTLVGDLEPTHAAAALSGLLIGAEIGSALAWCGDGTLPVILVASGSLAGLYGQVIRLAGRVTQFEDADRAVRAGLFQAQKLQDGLRKKKARA
jgi:2-dehydro-3-deoxygalactonokinase